MLVAGAQPAGQGPLLVLPAALQDVVYSALNTKAMAMVGGGAKNFSEWFAFLGKVAPPMFPGAPFQLDFPGEAATPAGMCIALRWGLHQLHASAEQARRVPVSALHFICLQLGSCAAAGMAARDCHAHLY